MKPIDIGKPYNQITPPWDDNSFNMSNGISQHEKAISFVINRGSALGVGSGCTGRFIELLIHEGFTPNGIVIPIEMINLARIHHPNINFNPADICKYPLSENTTL